MIFENCTGSTVNNILPDDEANEIFDKLDRNIIGVDWETETEIQEPAANMPQLKNIQYAALAGKEDDEGNDTKSTGVENGGKITGMRHDDEITGVDSNNESTESGRTGETDKADELALIEEATSEAERDIAEWNDLLAGTKTQN